MNRFLLSFAISNALLALGRGAAFAENINATKTSEVTKPNLIIILADDMGYGDSSVYGGWIKTPELEKLALEGLRFTDFQVSGNYDRATGAYSFWDSKNYSSLSGVLASNLDFSSSQNLYLGGTLNPGQRLDGMIGEVKVFNSVLGASEFQSEVQNMALKWANQKPPVSVAWRVIPADTNFPTHDEVIAGVSVTDSGFASPLPADPSNQDCTATFAEAIRAVSGAGGSVVFVPAGYYRLDGTLTIPSRVTLRGQWKAPTPGQPITGTILEAYAGRNDENGTPFIGLYGSSAVKDLAIWYPEQLPDSIVPYSPTIQRIDTGQNFAIEDITFVNSYIGFSTYQPSTTTGRPTVRNVYGTPLKTGIIYDTLADLGRVDNVHFSRDYWAGSGLPNAPTAGQDNSWLYHNDIGILARKSGWAYFSHVSVDGYNIGLAAEASPFDGSAPNGQYYDFNLTNCDMGVDVEKDAYAMLKCYWRFPE